MQYNRGGKDGTFTGQATFASLDASVVGFEEHGTALLAPNNDEYQARSSLLYVAAQEKSVRVLFDEGSDRSSAGAILAGARFFHTIEFGGGFNVEYRLSEHPCGPDVYRGRLAVDGEESFRLLWSVSGPRKLGTVTSTFRRSA